MYLYCEEILDPAEIKGVTVRGIEWSLRVVRLFASTSSDQICLVSREHFRKHRWRAGNTSLKSFQFLSSI